MQFESKLSQHQRVIAYLALIPEEFAQIFAIPVRIQFATTPFSVAQANTKRNWNGTLSTHCRSRILGSTSSTSRAAVSTMSRAPQLGHSSLTRERDQLLVMAGLSAITFGLPAALLGTCAYMV